MSCIITYKGKKYSDEQFKEYFINNKQEFATSITKNKDVMDSFKRKMEDIDYVFSQSPELASIGTKAQYLQYLSTIFKTSKVKDIVYHGTVAEFDKFDKDFINKDGVNSFGDKFYFLPKEMLHMIFKNQRVVPAILNMPTYTDFFEQGTYETLDNIRRFEEGKLEELAVNEPEQIHILGSKQDIEGFKEFVQGKQFQKLTDFESSNNFSNFAEEAFECK